VTAAPLPSAAVEVRLSYDEFKRARAAGIARMDDSQDQGLEASKRYLRCWTERLRDDVIGACAEMAFCKATGIPWEERINTFHRADVGEDIQIRGTWRVDGCLLHRPDEPAEHWYCLVTGDPPVMTIRGWIRGENARRDEWRRNWNGGSLVWAVPQAVLVPLRVTP